MTQLQNNPISLYSSARLYNHKHAVGNTEKSSTSTEGSSLDKSFAASLSDTTIKASGSSSIISAPTSALNVSTAFLLSQQQDTYAATDSSDTSTSGATTSGTSKGSSLTTALRPIAPTYDPSTNSGSTTYDSIRFDAEAQQNNYDITGHETGQWNYNSGSSIENYSNLLMTLAKTPLKQQDQVAKHLGLGQDDIKLATTIRNELISSALKENGDLSTNTVLSSMGVAASEIPNN